MHQFGHVFGIFATIAILFSATGCTTAQHRSMSYQDLNYFKVDCRIKTQQIAMLQSMRPTADEKIIARFNNVAHPWQQVTNPNEFYHRHNLGSNRIDWMINQHLMALKEC